MGNGGGPARSVDRVVTPLMASRSFRAAQQSRTRQAGHGPLASASGHRDQASLDKLIRDCQATARNNFYCRSILQGMRALTIGSSPTVQPRSEDEAWNAVAREVFLEWAQDADLTGQQSLWDLAGAVVTGWEDQGTVLLHKVLAGDTLKLEFIEGARLRNPRGISDTETHKGGVEIDEMGRPVAVHIAPWDRTGTSLNTISTVSVPFERVILLNNPRLLQPGTYRAEPGLASTVDIFEVLIAATYGSLTAYELATYLALIWMRKNPSAGGAAEQLGQSLVDGGDETTAADAHDRGELGPLSQLIGEVGEEVFQFKPEHPSTPFQAMLMEILRVICSNLDLPMGAGFAYFIRNYHASRSEMSVMWPRIVRRQDVLISKVIRPLYRDVIRMAIASGRLAEVPGWDRVSVSLGSMPVLDEATDVKTVGAAMSGGMMLPETAVRRITGDTDFEGFVKKYTEQTAMLRAAGVIPGAAPATQTVATEGSEVDDLGDGGEAGGEGNGQSAMGNGEGADGGDEGGEE